MKRLNKRTLINLTAFLILNGCANKPVVTKFDGKWDFCKNAQGETLACLKKEDVKKLREILIRCKGAQNER